MPEILLWQQVRGRTFSLRFRRQHPVGPYILDFFCPEVGLAVEVDGYSHGTGDRVAHDARRDTWLTAQGIEVLRISAETVLGVMSGALAMILEAAGRPTG